MKALPRLLLKNASSNVVRGLATAAVALTLPHFLTRALDPGRFAAWSLILQISSYASFLDFGLQTAVARFFAHSVEDDGPRRNSLVSTALAMLSVAGVVVLFVIAAVILFSARLFPGIPPALLGEFRLAASALALSACLLLPASTCTGILLGMHRNEFPTLSIALSRLLGACAVLLAVRWTHSLVVLSLLLGTANLAGGFSQFVAVRRLLPDLRASLAALDRSLAAELARYCAGLSVWSVGMLLVSGLDVTVVGHFRFAAVGVYSVAATLAMFLAGLNQAVLSALMTPLAALHARGFTREIAALVLRATRINSLANLTLVLLALVAGPPLLRLWVGPAYAQAAMPLLAVLLVAQAIRLAANPYGIALIAFGSQGRALLPVMAEGIVNLAASVAGILLLGPIGVAGGTLVGAVAGTAALLVHTAPRLEPELLLGRRDLLREGFLRPVLTLIPLAACVLAALASNRAALPLTLCGLGASTAIAFRNGRRASAPLPADSPALVS